MKMGPGLNAHRNVVQAINRKSTLDMYQQYFAASLRACRRSAGLTQRELISLMGLESRFQLSRIERGEHLPKLEQALRYEYLFGVPIKDMVPRLCDQVLNGLWEDIESQLGACDPAKDRRAKQKYETLCAAKERIEALSS
jgi:transcriptional regulator with XRE-family HTH domain